jgi:hypothetical protein
MNPVSGALELRVLAMNMADVRQTISAVGEQQAVAPASGAQAADVILELSAAAQQLMSRS